MLGPAPANQRLVRRHNLSVVLRHIAERGPRSRATIAAETGLNKTTVSSLVAELIARRLLADGVVTRGGMGRPAQDVALSGDGVAALGLEIQVDYLAAHAIDLAGRSRHQALVAADNRARTAEATVLALADLARDALRHLRAQGLLAVGATVAVPGLVDPRHGRLLLAPNLGWSDVPLLERLRAGLEDPGLRLDAVNEANLAALAELWSGAGREYRDFLYVSGEIGVGGGIIAGGELMRGARGFGGELGHMTMDPEGPPCRCGSRGCLEQFIGLEALLRAAGLQDTSGAGTATPAAALAERALAGDPATLDALAGAGRWLGIAAASVANLIDPAAIVLGGYFAPLTRWLAAPTAAEMRARVIAAPWAPPVMVASTLGREGAVRGAAGASLQTVLDDPIIVPEVSDPERRTSAEV